MLGQAPMDIGCVEGAHHHESWAWTNSVAKDTSSGKGPGDQEH